MAFDYRPRPTATGFPARMLRLLTKVVVWFLAISIGMTLVYRFVPVPITITMIADEHGFTKDWTSLSRIDRNMVSAVIAAEDGKFCTHNGFDQEAIEQAALRNAQGKRMRGGSTISQQTAKNVFLWPGRDWVRKGLETWFTALIEVGWGKRRIMEVYLNSIEWGPGVYGAEAAARKNFRVPAKSLTVAQSARLAAILPSPLKWKAAKPGPYVQRRSGKITRNARAVRREGLTACVL